MERTIAPGRGETFRMNNTSMTMGAMAMPALRHWAEPRRASARERGERMLREEHEAARRFANETENRREGNAEAFRAYLKGR